VTVQYKAIFSVAAVSAKTLGPAARDALLAAIAVLEGTPVRDAEYLGVRSVLSSSPATTSVGGSRGLAAAQFELLVATRLFFNSSHFPAARGNASELFRITSSCLVQAVKSRFFDGLVQQQSLARGPNELNAAEVVAVSFEDLVLNPAATNSAGSASSPLTAAMLAGVVAGALILFGLLSLLLYFGYTRCLQPDKDGADLEAGVKADAAHPPSHVGDDGSAAGTRQSWRLSLRAFSEGRLSWTKSLQRLYSSRLDVAAACDTSTEEDHEQILHAFDGSESVSLVVDMPGDDDKTHQAQAPGQGQGQESEADGKAEQRASLVIGRVAEMGSEDGSDEEVEGPKFAGRKAYYTGTSRI
jgi:hypothetical protein